MIKFYLKFLLFFLLIQTPANAYFGPAIGFGLIAMIILILLSIILALVAIFYSPIKKFILKFRNWKK